jgi:uncharacterized protein (DUF2384 family)
MSPIQIEMRATEETIDWAHDALGLNYREIGSLLQAHERTVMRWKSRETLASPRHRRRVEDLRELRYLLGEVFRDEQGANLWLHSSVPALRGRTPISYVRAGRVSRVVDLLATFQAGAHP